MGKLKSRLIVIAALIVASIVALFPREVIERVNLPDGSIRYDTVKRINLKRGLDLEGGIYIALEVDETRQAVTDPGDMLDRALVVIRNRIDKLGVAEPNVQKVGTDRIIVELPGIKDPERAEQIVNQTAYLQFQMTDKTGALEKIQGRIDQIVKNVAASPVAATRGDTATKAPSALPTLFSDTGTKQAARDSGAKADTAALPAGAGAFSTRVSATGQLPGEYAVRVGDYNLIAEYLSMPDVRAAFPPGKEPRWGNDTIQLVPGQMFRLLYVVDINPILRGEMLTDATAGQTPLEGTIVNFQLSREGGRRFLTETGRRVGDYMAIVLDDIVMGRPPVLQQAIGANGQITMGQGRPLQDAQALALVLKAGALPVPLKVVQKRNIGASLGADSIHDSIVAGVVGVGLVVLIMLGYYRFSGALAVGGLVLYVLFTLATLAAFDAVLTLPGLAGFVLSIGIAVDANVLIFERIREELDHGKTVRTSIDEGFKHAMSAIVDSNVSTVLTAMVLYQFGTGPVRGFAVTLIAGIAASMVTAIFVVRTFYLMWLSRARGAQALSI